MEFMYLVSVPLMEFMYLVSVPLMEFVYLVSVPLMEFMYLVSVPLMEFMYLVFTRMPGESYRRATHVFVFVFVLCISRANCVLILHERSGPRPLSDF